MTDTSEKSERRKEQDEYMGNIWGPRWSIIALIIVLIFISIAVCRYLVLQPDRLVKPEEIEEFGWR